jgi:hypothetical protein
MGDGFVTDDGEKYIDLSKIVFVYVGQPVFAMQTKRTQFGVDGQMASLIFHLYGYPPAKEVSVFPVNRCLSSLKMPRV